MKTIKKSDCDAEISRINYLIANYKYSEQELIFFKKLLANAHKQKKLLSKTSGVKNE